MPNKKHLLIIIISLILLLIVGIIYYYISYNPQTSQLPKETPVVLPQIQNKISCKPTDMECIINNLVDNFKKDCTPIELTVNPEEGSQANPIVISIYGFINNKCYYQTKGLNPDLICTFKKDYVDETTIRGLLGMFNIPNLDSFKKIKSESCK